jgi:hypothetical protein
LNQWLQEDGVMVSHLLVVVDGITFKHQPPTRSRNSVSAVQKPSSASLTVPTNIESKFITQFEDRHVR